MCFANILQFFLHFFWDTSVTYLIAAYVYFDRGDLYAEELLSFFVIVLLAAPILSRYRIRVYNCRLSCWHNVHLLTFSSSNHTCASSLRLERSYFLRQSIQRNIGESIYGLTSAILKKPTAFRQ